MPVSYTHLDVYKRQHLAAALDEPRHRDAAGFDLAVGDVAALLHLQPEVAEREIGPCLLYTSRCV